MDVSLVMFKADGTRREFPLRKRQVVLGRKNSCELRIPLNSVSRQHCEITVNNGEVKLRDLDSSNGTYHNSVRVQETMLSPGDEIVIGPVVFTIVINGQPNQIKPVRTIITGGNGKGSNGNYLKGEATSTDTGVMADQLKPADHTPTINLDDPIAALDAMAALDGYGEGVVGTGTIGLMDEDED